MRRLVRSATAWPTTCRPSSRRTHSPMPRSVGPGQAGAPTTSVAGHHRHHRHRHRLGHGAFIIDDTDVENHRASLFAVRSLLEPVTLSIPRLTRDQRRLGAPPPRDCWVQVEKTASGATSAAASTRTTVRPSAIVSSCAVTAPSRATSTGTTTRSRTSKPARSTSSRWSSKAAALPLPPTG